VRGGDEAVEEQIGTVDPAVVDLDRIRLGAVWTGRLDAAVDAERGEDAERVPRAVRVPPAIIGTDAVRGRHRGERIRHADLVRRRVENECVLVVQAPPARDDFLPVAELLRRRRATELHEGGVRPVSQLEQRRVDAATLPAMQNDARVDVPDAIRHAALFPATDLPAPSKDHPSRHVTVAGVSVVLPASLPFGTVFPERLDESEVEQVVDEIRRFLRDEAQRERAVWFVPDTTLPSGLSKRLRGLGMTPNEGPPSEPRGAAMVATAPPPPGPPDVITRRTESFEEFLDARVMTVEAFGLDERTRQALVAPARRLWEVESDDGSAGTFIALIEDEIVASARVQFGRTAAFMAGGGTRPDRRGRGVYRALVRARWDAAVERGTPVLTVGAGDQSRPILERLGFAIVGWYDCLADRLSGGS
jgi:GNAT superfamily N-acetyltransferase